MNENSYWKSRIRVFLTVLAGSLAAVDFSSAQTWTQAAAPAGGWYSFAVSANGAKLLAAGLDGNLYTSTNSGVSWTLQSGATNAVNAWTCLGSSADGSQLFAMDNDSGSLYASTNSGIAWTQLVNAPTGISSLAVSANGSVLAGVAGSTSLYISTNSGLTWAPPASPPVVPPGFAANASLQQLRTITTSADGTKMAVSAELLSGGIADAGAANSVIRFVTGVFTSTNSGASWQITTYNLEYNLNALACSANGSNLLLAGQAYYSFNPKYNVPAGQYWFYQNFLGYPLYHSADGGDTWSADWSDPALPAPVLSNGSAPNPSPYNYHAAYLEVDYVASDADGGICAALDNPDSLVYLSTNSGASWSPYASTPAGGGWNKIAISADGNLITLGSSGGGIYTLQSPPAPLLNISTAGGNLAFAWTVASTNLVLQQKTDLSAANWTTLTNQPVLINATLQDQIILPAANSRGFFRLAGQ